METILRKPRYSKAEFARRGRALYESTIRGQVEPADTGKIVAIDIESGEFAVADNVLIACEGLIAKKPDAQLWTLRIGHRAVHRIGAWHGALADQ
jgi:hypothetical protein